MTAGPPGCFGIHLVKSYTFPKTMLQQLVASECFATSLVVKTILLSAALGEVVADLVTAGVAVTDAEGAVVGVFVALGVGVGVGVGAEVSVGVGLLGAIGDALDVDLDTGALLQSNFFPDLTHRYLTLLTVLTAPAFGHEVPAKVAAFVGDRLAKTKAAKIRLSREPLIRISRS